MKQLVRRIGQTIALTLPVILVTTGTLAVTRVPWAPPIGDDQQVVAASSGSDGGIGRSATTADVTGTAAHPGLSPQDALRADLMAELRSQGAGPALDLLERTMREQPSLTPYCSTLARELGQAALKKYQGDAQRARSFARPVCDGSFAAGIGG
ncbi:membrane protein [Kitasatospora nipponensis]|uniref:Membrane protein n=1 Tax=Kitasatospora nipponensis TaxID=258049 RepID=A0ABP4GH61_9ACTN